MKRKKNILTGFAIFAAILMLAFPSIATPVQQKVVMETSEPQIVNDAVEGTCILCAQDISAKVSAAVAELKTMEKEGLIPPELSEEYEQIMMIASTTNLTTIGCDLIDMMLWFSWFILSGTGDGPINPDDYPLWKWLAEWHYENCL